VGAWALLTPVAAALRLEDGVVGVAAGVAALTVAGLPLKALAAYVLGLHRRAWRRAGVADLRAIAAGAAGVTAVQLTLVLAAFPVLPVPRSLPLIEGALAVLVLGAAVLARRIAHEQAQRLDARERGAARRVLVVGAGEAGLLAVRDMLRNRGAGLDPVGFLDDDPLKLHRRHGGLPVLGRLADLPAIVRAERVDDVLVAMPSQPRRVVRRALELAREAGVEGRAIPALHELASGRVAVSAFREVRVEDLLRRAPVQHDTASVEGYLRGRVVLVTGAGGSIGSELARRVAAFEPAALVLLGRGENSVFEIDRELARTHPQLRRLPVICDVRDEGSLRRVFERHRPEVVFHAAAHKHVPLMEAHPEQAVLNNVGGTRNLARLALAHGVRRFVNVSTDKAVNPTSVMGATKRVAEAVVAEAAARCAPGGAFVSVRFGNVLGSRGSLIPILRDQIRRGGPVTITHRDMVRYFMTIPEAAELVLQAGALAGNGRVYVLDMGSPVKIVDLARDLIAKSGLTEGRDVAIEFTGLRPGEKLYEELLTAEEGTDASSHQKIFVTRQAKPPADLDRLLGGLFAAADASDGGAVREALRTLVPSYATPPAPRGDGHGGLPPAAPVIVPGPLARPADEDWVERERADAERHRTCMEELAGAASA
jgi:FlaA1/EpsC-like NDP-sugar epimerase